MAKCIYRFQIHAVTEPGEAIALVGSAPEMGEWDVARAVPLRTQGDRYPLWWVDLALDDWAVESELKLQTIEYKYIRLHSEDTVWETSETNRWVPLETGPFPSPIVVEDGWFGTIPAYPYGYFAEPVRQAAMPSSSAGLKVLVLGSSVALGCSAWMLRGWAWQLGQALQQYGHQLVNCSQVGANISSTIARFSGLVEVEQPDIVIIALSLGNEGLASCDPRHRTAIQRRFEKGLQQLIRMTREIGTYPILAGPYPNGDYSAEHYGLLQETQQRMLSWGIPVLNWLDSLSDGQGRWQAGLSFDAAHPNTIGHQRMFEHIDLSLFALTKTDLATQQQSQPVDNLYQDDWGFQVDFRKAEGSLRLSNPTAYSYRISSDWQALQTALRETSMPAGLYLAEVQASVQAEIQANHSISASLLSLSVQDDGTIAEELYVPSGANLIFYPVFYFLGSQRYQVLFHDGHLTILKVDQHKLYVINESDHEYNLQPMWQDVRAALKVMPPGLYTELQHPDTPFRTLIVGSDGLESRVKAPAQSALRLEYQCSLAEVSRVAIIPLGDRCAVRMLLYKLEYDGPAFPFDLTRTTNLADVADMIQNDFRDMWNPAYLHYSAEAGRIYHTKWTGLSFAHEVDDSDDPDSDLTPVYKRMQVRYSARTRRFGYTVQHCDKALFVRTGLCDRGMVIDLIQKLEAKYPGKPFRLLLLSPQSSDEFADLPKVLHYNLEFNPDRMYEDLDYWLDCTEVMRGILNSLGVSSCNLFWCPPNLPETV